MEISKYNKTVKAIRFLDHNLIHWKTDYNQEIKNKVLKLKKMLVSERNSVK